MSEAYERDFDAHRLIHTATGDWMEPEGRNREAVYSFLFNLKGDDVFDLATLENLDRSTVPEPLLWHMGLNHARRRREPNETAVLTETERSSIEGFMTEYGSSLTPRERRTEVVFDAILRWE